MNSDVRPSEKLYFLQMSFTLDGGNQIRMKKQKASSSVRPCLQSIFKELKMIINALKMSLKAHSYRHRSSDLKSSFR